MGDGILKKSHAPGAQNKKKSVRIQAPPVEETLSFQYMTWFRKLILAIETNNYVSFLECIGKHKLMIPLSQFDNNAVQMLQLALQLAIMSNYAEAIQYAVLHEASIDTALYDPTFNALGLAISHGRSKSTKCLIELGADINTCFNSDQGPPIQMAIQAHDIVLVRSLIARGAKLDASLWWHCIKTDSTQGLSILARHNPSFMHLLDRNQRTSFHIAAILNKTHVLSVLIQLRGNANVIDAQGQTPLHYAVALNDYKLTEQILNADVSSIDVLDNYNKNALAIACANGNYPLVCLLLTHNADVSVEDADGNLLHYEPPCSPVGYRIQRVLETHNSKELFEPSIMPLITRQFDQMRLVHNQLLERLRSHDRRLLLREDEDEEIDIIGRLYYRNCTIS